MQLGCIQRQLYAPPPKHINPCWNIAWKLLRLPYVVVEAVRQWLCVVEECLISGFKIELLMGVEHFFYKCGGDKHINLIVVKFDNDFLIAGPSEGIEDFLASLNQRFELGHIGRGASLKFLGCSITTLSFGDVELFMPEYIIWIKPIKLTVPGRLGTSTNEDETETSLFRSLDWTLLYLGQATLPQAYYLASKCSSAYTHSTYTILSRLTRWFENLFCWSQRSYSKSLIISPLLW